MGDTRHKNAQWKLEENPAISIDQAQLAVLMDIRDELQTMSRVLACPNFQRIPRYLREIAARRRRTAGRRRS